jgi:hypothetical protein
MTPSFDEFLELAEARLARAAVEITDGARVGPATCAALSAATRSLMTLSTRYGQMPNGRPTTSWAAGFCGLLASADRRLRRHTSQAATPSAADELIGDAARLLTVAQDLIATHLTTPDPPRTFARTPTGAELLDAPLREHILRRAAELAGHLAVVANTSAVFDDLTRERPHLLDAYRPRDRDLGEAALKLSDAAACCPEPCAEQLELTPAPVLARAVTYPAPGEDPADAAEKARTDLERMATAAYQAAHALRTGERPPIHAAGDLAEIAANLAVAHVLAADLLTRLAPHLPPAAGLNPADGADKLRATGAAWASVRRPWAQTVSVPDSGPRSPLTVQAHSIAIRLGRLLYADPAWGPPHGPGTPRAIGDLLDPRVLNAICVALSALPRSSADIAINHARLISDRRIDLYSAARAHRPPGESRRFYRLQPAQRAELTTAYKAAANASTTAVRQLALLGRGHHILSATALMRPCHVQQRTEHAGISRALPTVQNMASYWPASPKPRRPL